jgi:hypothetical protein
VSGDTSSFVLSIRYIIPFESTPVTALVSRRASLYRR